jgi:hypothetical protein
MFVALASFALRLFVAEPTTIRTSPSVTAFAETVFTRSMIIVSAGYALCLGCLASIGKLDPVTPVAAIVSTFVAGTVVNCLMDVRFLSKSCQLEDCYINLVTGGLASLIMSVLVGLAIVIGALVLRRMRSSRVVM